MRVFEIYWKKDSGGGLEYVLGDTMLFALNSFCEYWQDVGQSRNVYNVSEVEINKKKDIEGIERFPYNVSIFKSPIFLGDYTNDKTGNKYTVTSEGKLKSSKGDWIDAVFYQSKIGHFKFARCKKDFLIKFSLLV